MSEYVISEFKESLTDSYNKFVLRNFGRNSYQSNSEYINWLYFKNPYGRGYSDFLLALDNSKNVAGCVRKIRYEILNTETNTKYSCTSIHNLMVDIEHRNGVGFLLIRDFLKNEKSFLIPGVIGMLSDSYKNLGSKPLKSFWGFKMINPNLFKLLKRMLGLRITREEVISNCNFVLRDGVQIEFDFNKDLIEILNNKFSSLIFTEEYLRWRLFDDKKLSTIILWSKDRKSLIMMSIGKRRRVPVGRIFFSIFDNMKDGQILLRNSLRLLGLSGCPLALITSADSKFIELSKLENIKSKNVMPDTYFFSKLTSLTGVVFWPLVSDLGFEERFSKS